MIYITDPKQYKIVFDKTQLDKAYALSLEEQEKLKELQILVLTGEAKGDEVLKGIPFQNSTTLIQGKKAMELHPNAEENIPVANVSWKIIKEEGQEGDFHYTEIV